MRGRRDPAQHPALPVILWPVHRSRDFGISRRGDALDAARPRLSEPAGLGPCGRPDRRVAHVSGNNAAEAEAEHGRDGARLGHWIWRLACRCTNKR